MKRRPVWHLQVSQHRREEALVDDQPHMTLTPEKDGRLWRDGEHGGHSGQRQRLLSAREAFFQGFHAGARWGYRIGRRRRTQEKKGRSR